MLRAVWFTPTVDAGRRGRPLVPSATRSRCRRPDPRPRSAARSQGVLDRPEARDRYALCGTAEPGTAGFEQRICAGPAHLAGAAHRRRSRPARYPGEDKVRAAGQTPCQDAGRAVAGDPLDYQWSYQWPNLQQWEAGQTYGVCWAPS